jgi:hypothetical protein
LPASQGDRLSDEADLARPVGLYEAGQFEPCAKALAELLDPRSSRALEHPEVVERARVYFAACLIGSGRAEEADAPLRDAIRDNPQMQQPDSLVFPQPVIERFLRVRQGQMDEIRAAERARIEKAQEALRAKQRAQQAEQARLAELERLATEETVIVRNRRAVALLPFGVGQFQNDDTALGWLFLTSEVVLGGIALTSLVVRSHLVTEANRTGNTLDNDDVNQRLADWQTTLELSSWGFLAVAAAGIVEAQLSFEPEFRTTRRRPLPRNSSAPAPSAAFRLAPVAGGLSLGVVGSF